MRLECPWCHGSYEVEFTWLRHERVRSDGDARPADKPRARVVVNELAGSHVCRGMQ